MAHTWTRDRIIERLRTEEARLGHPPRSSAWRASPDPDDHPPRSRVIKVFGSWGAALEAAGIERLRHWTRESVVEAIQVWSERHGRPPTWEEWRRNTTCREHPAASTVIDKCGSWQAALQQAGVAQRCRGTCSNCGEERWIAENDECADCRGYERATGRKREPRAMRERRWRERIVAAMRAWYDHYGESPTSAEWSRFHAARLKTVSRDDDLDRVAYSQVRRYFGSWGAAVAAAGLPPTREAWEYHGRKAG